MPRVRSQVTIRKANKYLKKVKDAVSPDEYQIFMNLILESKDKKRDIGPTIGKVIELFKHNGRLLSGFNRFCRKGYKIVPLMRPGRYEIKKKLFVDFVHKIKTIMNEEDGHMSKAFGTDLGELVGRPDL